MGNGTRDSRGTGDACETMREARAVAQRIEGALVRLQTATLLAERHIDDPDQQATLSAAQLAVAADVEALLARLDSLIPPGGNCAKNP